MNCVVAYALCITASIIGISAWKDLRTGERQVYTPVPKLASLGDLPFISLQSGNRVGCR